MCLQAGNVNTGSFDPTGPAIKLVRAGHPDAHPCRRRLRPVGGRQPGVSPPSSRVTTKPIPRTDGHKWLNVPYDCGYAFVRDPIAQAGALSPQGADYIVYGAAERDEFRWVPEYSRRARGFATYAALPSLGADGVRELIERCCRLARRAADGLSADGEGVEILNDVVLDQVLVRSGRPTAATATRRTRERIARVQADGTCWLAGTTWQARPPCASRSSTGRRRKRMSTGLSPRHPVAARGVGTRA